MAMATNINISNLIKLHSNEAKVYHSRGSSWSLWCVRINENEVTDFHEKPSGDGGLINGGYFV